MEELSTVGYFTVWILCYTTVKAAKIASDEQKDWHSAQKGCHRKGQKLLEFSGIDKTSVTMVIENLQESTTNLWTGGMEVYTPWLQAEGCYNFISTPENNNKIMKSFTIADNQASVCALLCRGGLFIRLSKNKCECLVRLIGVSTQVDPRLCDQPCPGNGQENCGGSQTYTVYRPLNQAVSPPRSIHSCAVVVYTGDKWTLQARNCDEKLPFLFQTSTNRRMLDVNSDKSTWFEMRHRMNNESKYFFTKIDHLNTNVSGLQRDKMYWVGVQRNKTIIWSEVGDDTGQCLAVKKINLTEWEMIRRSCEDRLRYICSTSDKVTLTSTQTITLETTTPLLSFDEIKNTMPTNIIPSTESQETKELLGKDIQLYIYIVIGVGSAVFVSILFGCGIMIRRCTKTKLKNNNNTEITKTSVVSNSDWTDPSPGVYDACNLQRGEEHIYNEIVDVKVDVIRINNYSEPLPLKESTTTVSREYADPYDAIKVKSAVKKIKRKKTKNYSSVGPANPDKVYQQVPTDNNTIETQDNNHYQVCNVEVQETKVGNKIQNQDKVNTPSTGVQKLDTKTVGDNTEPLYS